MPTERDLLDSLWERLTRTRNGETWRFVMAEHVRLDPTYGNRIIDAISLDTWGSGRYAITGYEIKTSRSDWLRELRDPTKGEAWRRYLQHFYVLAPPNVVRRDELPNGWGHLQWTGSGIREQVKSGHHAAAVPPPPRTVAAIMRAVQQTAIHHTRGVLSAQVVTP